MRAPIDAAVRGSTMVDMSTIDLEAAEVLITGGSEGIGKGLARHFLGAGARVLITGRNDDRLRRAAADLPGVLTFRSDIGVVSEREALAAQLQEALPKLNVVIQNAGIQRRVSLAEDQAPWPERQAEIDALLCGPIHLNHLLVPRLLAQGRPSLIVNVTSGGAFLPQPFAPVYSACKAALHSYTVNLRYALVGTPCRVVELIPPAVATSLAGAGATHGVPLEQFVDSAFGALAAGEADEIGFGMTATEPFDEAKATYRTMFEQFATRWPVRKYAGG